MQLKASILDIAQIESTLKQLTGSIPQIQLSMIVTPDGLTLAYEGKVEDAENVGALCIELELICKKITLQLDGGQLKEMFIRSDTSSITILPITDKGILACLTSTDINSRMMMHVTWKTVNQLDKIM